MGPPSRRRRCRRRRRRCVGWIDGRVRPRAATCQYLASFRPRHSVCSSSIYARAERALSRTCRMGRAAWRARVRALLLCIGENLIYFSTFAKAREKKRYKSTRVSGWSRPLAIENAQRPLAPVAHARAAPNPRDAGTILIQRDTGVCASLSHSMGTREVRRCAHPLGSMDKRSKAEE